MLSQKIVRTVARSKTRDIFGELKTEEFYVADRRELQAERAKEALRKLEDARGEVNKIVAAVDGEYLQAKIEADAYFEKQKLLAQAIEAEGIAEARGIEEMNEAMALAGGEALVKLKIAESLQGKKILLLPVAEGGMNLKTTDINQLIDTFGIRALSPSQPQGETSPKKASPGATSKKEKAQKTGKP